VTRKALLTAVQVIVAVLGGTWVAREVYRRDRSARVREAASASPFAGSGERALFADRRRSREPDRRLSPPARRRGDTGRRPDGRDDSGSP